MEDEGLDILNPFRSVDLDIAGRADGIKQWAITNREAIQPIRSFFDTMIVGIESALQAVLPLVMLALIALLAGKSDRFEAGVRPVLDTMQTIPAFVYLVPLVVVMVGISNVSGVLVTIIFALPPLVRLTSLGICGVNPSVVEAARAFGATPLQILTKVELPLATPTILAGLNQTIMLSLSMVVTASMISVQGPGERGAARHGPARRGQGHRGGPGHRHPRHRP